MLEINELKSLGISIGLILLNVLLMGVLSYTPVSGLLGLAFGIPIVGIIVYGAMLSGGNYIAERGVKREDIPSALLGVGILQFAYGSFGAGLLKNVSLHMQVLALGITGIVTTFIAVLAGLVVYGTDRNFSSWQNYASYLFIGVLGFGFLGTFYAPILIVGFLCALAGFIVYLVYEIWEMRSHSGKVYMNAIGIYVAYMGVFIQILQIILSLLERE